MSDAPLVLNVDDHDESRYARSKILQQAGFRVAEARSAADALRLIAGELPTVALVDVQLPDMSGAELCRRILEHGADACLVEPVDPEVLLATVRALLRARRAEEA